MSSASFKQTENKLRVSYSVIYFISELLQYLPTVPLYHAIDCRELTAHISPSVLVSPRGVTVLRKGTQEHDSGGGCKSKEFLLRKGKKGYKKNASRETKYKEADWGKIQRKHRPGQKHDQDQKQSGRAEEGCTKTDRKYKWTGLGSWSGDGEQASRWAGRRRRLGGKAGVCNESTTKH